MDRRSFLKTTGISVSALLSGCVFGGDGESGTTRAKPGTRKNGTTATTATGKTRGTTTTTVRKTIPSYVTIEWGTSGFRDEATQADTRETLRDAGLSSVRLTFSSPYGGVEDLLHRGSSEHALYSVGGSRAPRVLAETEGLEPLDSILSEQSLASIRESTFEDDLRLATHDGSLYGLPVRTNPWGMLIYRRDHLMNAGYDPDEWQASPPTWQEFHRVVANVLADVDDAGIGAVFPGRSLAFAGSTLPTAFRSRGGTFFGDPTKYLFGPVGERPVTIGERPTAEALKMYRRFLYGSERDGTSTAALGPITPVEVLDWGYLDVIKAFAERSGVAMLGPLQDLTMERELQSGTTQDDILGFAMPPSATTVSDSSSPLTGGPRPTHTTDYIVVNPHAPPEEKAAAGDVLEAMHSKTFRLYALENLGWLPPSRTDLYDNPRVQNHPIIGGHTDVLQRTFQRAVPAPQTPAWKDEGFALVRHGRNALRKSGSIESELKAVQKKFESIEESYGS